MDVGSTICTPENPKCEQCPLKKQCCSFKTGRQHELPRLPAKKQMTEVTEVAMVLRRGQKVLMRQYPEGERWAGLWDFARFSVSKAEGDQLLALPRHENAIQPTLFESKATPLAIQTALKHTGLRIEAPVLRKQIQHTVTRYRIRLLCVVSTRLRGSVNQTTGLHWQTLEQLNDLPLSTTARTIADIVQSDS
jgi:A/G-specific adenine glycosylase